MPDSAMKELLKKRACMVENAMARFFDANAKIPDRLAGAMRYSLEAGGKRLRPALCLSGAALFNMPPEKILPFACAIEMIHTYSLIHDDLPAMDNDDLRRGKPSCHIAFGEATAILAGDALLTDAFWLALQTDADAVSVLKALEKLAAATGSSGMVGGQQLDMDYTGKSDITETEIKVMQAMKTGALIQGACLCGALLADAPENGLQAVANYGEQLGRAFQIADDILDMTSETEILGKPAKSDMAAGKNSYPAVAGLDRSRKLAGEAAKNAVEALHDFTGLEAEFLRALALYAVERAS